MVDYEITKAEPQQLRLQVKYTKADCPDYWINFTVEDFSEANLHEVAKGGADRAQNFWDGISNLPDQVTLSNPTGVSKDRVYADSPTFDKATQDATFTWVESDDALTQTWTVTDKSDGDKEAGLRQERDKLLRETDHYGLSDVTMSAEMTTYRQALRDIPQQADFPTTVTWPAKPS